MPSQISKRQFDKLRALVDEGRVDAVYSYLAERGYHYARWAAGSAGEAPETAVPGLDPLSRKQLSSGQIALLRIELASAYLDTLEAQFKHAPCVARDVRADETATFHGQAFRTHGLHIEDWTLHNPLVLQEKLGGHEAVERYWVAMLRTVARLDAQTRARIEARL